MARCMCASGTGTGAITTGCGISGDGSPDRPLSVVAHDPEEWPFACPIATSGSFIYCTADGNLVGTPPVYQATISQTSDHAVSVTPGATMQVIETLSVTLVNPDPCRPMQGFAYRQFSPIVNMPVGSTIQAGIDSIGYAADTNTGSTVNSNWRTNITRMLPVIVPAGGSLPIVFNVTAAGTGGATVNYVRAEVRAWGWSLPT